MGDPACFYILPFLPRWTWYHDTNECYIFGEDTCQDLAKNDTKCGCFTAPRCQNWDSETTPTLVGGVETVEVLLKRGPDSGIVSDLPEDRQFPGMAIPFVEFLREDK